MQELSDLDFSVLIDMLVDHTARYSQLLVDGNRGEEYEASKKLIKLIQAEIGSRNPSTTIATAPDPVI